VSHGDGIYIYDDEGRRYLDGCSGAVTANLGHANRRIRDAAVRQMERIAFAYRLQFENVPARQLAELLVQLSPPELNRVFFVNSGSEAVETAVKLARQYWWAVGERGKALTISRRPSFHGVTLGALALTAYAPLNIPFRPLVAPSPKVSAPFCYHCPLAKSYPDCQIACATELQTAIEIHGADNISAFICEPIGGSSTGAAVPPDEYYPLIERICNENNILLIVDDVMTGVGRTGTFYGYEHWDITPDIVAISKGLSAGYSPVAAILASDTIVEPVLGSGGFMHGHTHAGNPLSCAIALEVVRTIVEDRLVENARDVGTYLHEKLRELPEEYQVIGDIRGRGLMAGLEVIRDRASRTPFPANWLVALELTEIARGHGLLLYPRRSLHGLAGDHVLIAPPLTIDRKGIDELVAHLTAALDDLTKVLQRYLEKETGDYEAATIERYQQDETVPDYARADLSESEGAEDANVTGAMEHGRMGFPGGDDAEGDDEK
jgi:adenosylmethionine-8-amino-7-oxononanoate aminotransferase